MKKIFSLLLALLLCFSFSACGKSEKAAEHKLGLGLNLQGDGSLVPFFLDKK